MKENNTKKDFLVLRDVSACSEIPRRERFKILLLRKGISQNKLADEVGISKATMSNIVNGRWEPTSLLRLRIAQALECDSLVLFGNSQYFREWEKTFKENKKEK